VTAFDEIAVLLAQAIFVEPLDDVEHADDHREVVDAQRGG